MSDEHTPLVLLLRATSFLLLDLKAAFHLSAAFRLFASAKIWFKFCLFSTTWCFCPVAPVVFKQIKHDSNIDLTAKPAGYCQADNEFEGTLTGTGATDVADLLCKVEVDPSQRLRESY